MIDFTKNNNDDPRSFADTENTGNNKFLSKNIGISYNRAVIKRNANTLVIGGAGSGKTHGFIKNNLLKSDCSFIVTDRDGELFNACFNNMIGRKYKISCIDFTDPSGSFKYNPFDYVNEDNIFNDLCYIAEILSPLYVDNKKDAFWNAMLKGLFTAAILKVYSNSENRTLRNVVSIMNQITSSLDTDVLKIKELFSKRDENNVLSESAYHLWSDYEALAPEAKREIALMWNSHNKILTDNEVMKTFDITTIDINRFRTDKSILFISVPGIDISYNPFVTLIYEQVFNFLYKNYDKTQYSNHIEIILDEFANIRMFHNFEMQLAVASSHNVSVSIIIQDIKQLDMLVLKDKDTILSCCDSFVLLKTNSKTNTDFYKKLGISSSDIRAAKDNMAFVKIRGVDPVLDYKLPCS